MRRENHEACEPRVTVESRFVKGCGGIVFWRVRFGFWGLTLAEGALGDGTDEARVSEVVM